MKPNVVHKLLSQLEQLVHRETATGTEFWLASDLQTVLGYTRWSNFVARDRSRDHRLRSRRHRAG